MKLVSKMNELEVNDKVLIIEILIKNENHSQLGKVIEQINNLPNLCEIRIFDYIGNIDNNVHQ